MIKCSILVKRKDGLSVDEFQRSWRDEHGLLAAKVPGLRRYIQCLTLPEEYLGEKAPITTASTRCGSTTWRHWSSPAAHRRVTP